jgi:predicted GIY-YIG superfamily endonuclease
MQFFYVYVGKRKGDQWYIGFSTDLRRRVQEHNQKYDFDLLYYEAYTSETKARERERKLKYYGSAWRGLKDRITE